MVILKNFCRFLTIFAGPLVRLYIEHRIKKGLEDPTRKTEHFGIPSKNRPFGKLVWIHAVSVGETNSIIPIIKMLKEKSPDLNILLTTTTLTSSKIVEERLGDLVTHQFAPFDIHMWVSRFIRYWKPCAALFVESEIWPNTLFCLKENDIPAYLINLRISSKSLKNMYNLKKYLNIKPFSLFKEVTVPSAEHAEHAKNLGATNIKVIPNLKTLADRLPYSEQASTDLKNKIGGRKAWIAVSSHKGEEEIILDIMDRIKQKFTDHLTIIAVRHPARFDEVYDLCVSKNLSVVKHTEMQLSDKKIDADILLVDQMGVLGQYFNAIDTCFVCGSLIPGIGGHNFLEPLQFGCNVATGEYIENFMDMYSYVEDICKIRQEPEDIADFVIDSFEHFKKDENSKMNLPFKKLWESEVYSILKEK